MKKAGILSLLILFASAAFAQESSYHNEEADSTDYPFLDSIPSFFLKAYTVSAEEGNMIGVPREIWLKRNVMKVYPYAKLAAELLENYDEQLDQYDKKRHKRRFTKKANKLIKKEFEDFVKSLSITPGKMLVKLIYRETGLTAYEVIKEYRNGMQARLWQTAATLGGADLTLKYEPDNLDSEIDQCIKKYVEQIENGELEVEKITAETLYASSIAKNKN